jgi:elongation factor P--(R)-beta-lysine ligase
MRSGRDDWAACASAEALQSRARMLACIRSFFASAGVLEVETPILSQAGATDPALASFVLASDPPGTQPDADGGCYLQTSPEFPMKRLLASGVGPIYQICKVFRDGERGRRHHPEFTLLEWYRPGRDYGQLMDEVADLVRSVLGRPTMPAEQIRYRDLFRNELNIDPWTASPQALQAAAAEAGIPDADRLELDQDGWLDLLLTQCLEPRLGQHGMSFLCDYPPSQAALARLRRADDVQDGRTVAERFELYIEGVELANGFQELTDAGEQRDRFRRDLDERRRYGLPGVPPDERLLAALEAGMPDSSGVALGLDRLLMIATGADHIDRVLAFPIERA